MKRQRRTPLTMTVDFLTFLLAIAAVSGMEGVCKTALSTAPRDTPTVSLSAETQSLLNFPRGLSGAESIDSTACFKILMCLRAGLSCPELPPSANRAQVSLMFGLCLKLYCSRVAF
ncbi:hypothetical protein Baya_13056 [Bagarius yarrelli]|uniref:Uncharacterized protein n=1 Tax=Bagarius yarrelli TaxID=175774 RepID=A0A556V4T7_BAGYA|nr:hypothetical protein Baya_13056 [Bagarius yarrelli]